MSILSEQDADELTEFCAQKAAVDDENDLFHLVGAIVARHEAEALLSARAAYLRAFSDAPTQDAVHVLTWLMDRAASVEAQGGAE